MAKDKDKLLMGRNSHVKGTKKHAQPGEKTGMEKAQERKRHEEQPPQAQDRQRPK